MKLSLIYQEDYNAKAFLTVKIKQILCLILAFLI